MMKICPHEAPVYQLGTSHNSSCIPSPLLPLSPSLFPYLLDRGDIFSDIFYICKFLQLPHLHKDRGQRDVKPVHRAAPSQRLLIL